MKKDELSEVLFKELVKVKPYPNGVKEVENMIDKTVFLQTEKDYG